jgi:GMP synthase-like glutamine amidotransferase
MSRRLLVLDNALHRILFRPARHWLRYLRGIDVDVVNVPSGRPIPPLDGYSHMLLTGSEASILQATPWFEREAAAVLDAAERGVSILGSCFGHQMLAYALTGPESVARSPKPEVGWIELEILDDDELLTDVPNPWHMFCYHFDEVVGPTPPWRALARSRDCPTHILRFGELPIWGIQAHPELPLSKARLFLAFYPLLAGRERRRLMPAMRKPSREDRIADRVVARFLATGPSSSPEGADTSGR